MTPIAVRSDSDLGGANALEDAAFVNEYGADGTFRNDHVVHDASPDGDGDDVGDGNSGQVGSVSGGSSQFPVGCIMRIMTLSGVRVARLMTAPRILMMILEEVMIQAVVMVAVLLSPPLRLLTRRCLACSLGCPFSTTMRLRVLRVRLMLRLLQ